MLKVEKKLVVVAIILVITLLLAMSVKVEATGIIDNPVDLTGNLDIITGGDDINSTNEINNTTMLPEINNTIENTTIDPIINTPSVIQPVTNTDTEKNNTTENTLPKTGVTEDITVMFFIIVCLVSAIYAYKKIKDYNI